MVIQKFNKLIRNKWVWGVFAIAVSAAFCFDDLFTSRDRGEREQSSVGTVNGESVDARLFGNIQEDIRGFGRYRDDKRSQTEVNRDAWKNYAAMKTAEKLGLTATDADVQAALRNERAFQRNGAFSFEVYQLRLREFGVSLERFEDYIKRQLTLQRVCRLAHDASFWVSPMEVDRAAQDRTDRLTVKIAKFEEDKKEAAKITVGDKEMKAWYEKNSKSLELPERFKLRYIKYDATDKALLAKMNVTTNELHDYYDATVDKYTTTDTNGVEHVKAFAEVKDKVDAELRQIMLVQCLETNLIQRAYSETGAKGKARLSEIAKADKREIRASDWVAVEGKHVDGFMTDLRTVFTGADPDHVKAQIAEIDPASDDLRFAVVLSEKAVWLVEKSEVSKAHIPTYAESKIAIEPRVLLDARADAFKAKVEAIAKQGPKAVAAVKGCTTNITFSVSEFGMGKMPSFDNAWSVIQAATKLQKGEVSEFTLLSQGQAILVVCEDRVPGDVAALAQARQTVAGSFARMYAGLPDEWLKANRSRMDIQPSAAASEKEPEATPDAE